MTSYDNGAGFERLMRDWMRAKGYFVIRSAGSRGAVDLCCFNGKELVLLQCKSERKARGAYAEAKSDLDEIIVPPNTLKYLIVRRGKTEIIVKEIGTGKSVTYSVRAVRREINDASA